MDVHRCLRLQNLSRLSSAWSPVSFPFCSQKASLIWVTTPCSWAKDQIPYMPSTALQDWVIVAFPPSSSFLASSSYLPFSAPATLPFSGAKSFLSRCLIQRAPSAWNIPPLSSPGLLSLGLQISAHTSPQSSPQPQRGWAPTLYTLTSPYLALIAGPHCSLFNDLLHNCLSNSERQQRRPYLSCSLWDITGPGT